MKIRLNQSDNLTSLSDLISANASSSMERTFRLVSSRKKAVDVTWDNKYTQEQKQNNHVRSNTLCVVIIALLIGLLDSLLTGSLTATNNSTRRNDKRAHQNYCNLPKRMLLICRKIRARRECRVNDMHGMRVDRPKLFRSMSSLERIAIVLNVWTKPWLPFAKQFLVLLCSI